MAPSCCSPGSGRALRGSPGLGVDLHTEPDEIEDATAIRGGGRREAAAAICAWSPIRSMSVQSSGSGRGRADGGDREPTRGWARREENLFRNEPSRAGASDEKPAASERGAHGAPVRQAPTQVFADFLRAEREVVGCELGGFCGASEDWVSAVSRKQLCTKRGDMAGYGAEWLVPPRERAEVPSQVPSCDGCMVIWPFGSTSHPRHSGSIHLSHPPA